MTNNTSQIAGNAKDQLDTILILTDLAKAGVENGTLSSYGDLYLFFNVLNLLSLRAINNLKKLQG